MWSIVGVLLSGFCRLLGYGWFLVFVWIYALVWVCAVVFVGFWSMGWVLVVDCGCRVILSCGWCGLLLTVGGVF